MYAVQGDSVRGPGRYHHDLCSFISHFARHAPPFHHTSRMSNSDRSISPAQSEYMPPSPMAFCSGTATSAAMNADPPRKALLVATADEERPLFASTM